ncbi:YozE family protein [Loigolactobacillus iwatensis]|uniref:YozE family protein n=1 Tax=Loigolactobacillus iwatensis TaxID=1267156 RepID=UPI000F7E13AF|nr:YozE family protein [Loigolactobacillus iwatensis]
MRKSFYQFLMTQRNPNSHDEVAEFAANAFFDQSFPKLEEDYDKISKYLEENGGYLPTMTIFDEAFQRYQEQASLL